MTRSRLWLFALVAAAALLWWAGPAARLAVVCGLLLFAPGFVIARLLPGPDLDGPFVGPAVWLGLSISVVALLYEAATFTGLALAAPVLAALALGCALGAAALLWRGMPGEPRWPQLAGHHYALGAALLATMGLRLYQIRTLALPSWVDSVHHALLIRVAIERGQAPIDLTPYMPITELPYHWGYHVLAAASAQLAGVSVPQVMLWQGQALNTLHVLAVAALAAALWRRPWAGVAAGVVVGCISFMPAFYVSWGRYTQLTGLLLLPPLAICWRALLQTGRLRHAVASALLLAGLNLVHFRILVFALPLLAIIAAIELAGMPLAPRAALAALVRAAGVALAALVLTAPWLWLLARRQLSTVIAQPEAFFSADASGGINAGLMWAGQNRLLVALALLGALWGIATRRQAALAVVLWVAALVLMANPQLLVSILPVAGIPLLLLGIQQRRAALALAGGALLLCNPWLLRLPSSWLITNDVVVISLFLPIGLCVGLLCDGLPAALARLPRARYAPQAAGLALLALAIWGAWGQRDIINPTTVLATQEDVDAIAWVGQHTPPDARFLIDAVPWLGIAQRGVDGGWWLLPLAGRWVSTPPVLFTYGPQSEVDRAITHSRALAALAYQDRASAEALLDQEQIDYIYLTPQSQNLTRAFSNRKSLAVVYQNAKVTILAVGPNP
ncbi:hypothetical protein F8S13_16365 [Chloroflexia bacterium SDU3-3]|nr:hypothetical protein F8S13_16365 [Chloroflexia bacterium SDU3-3]